MGGIFANYSPKSFRGRYVYEQGREMTDPHYLFWKTSVSTHGGEVSVILGFKELGTHARPLFFNSVLSTSLFHFSKI